LRENQRLLTEIQNDLDAAERIQRALLPRPGEEFNELKVGWYFEPSGSIGGDLFNIFPIDHRHVGFFLLDVQGHGVQAALLAVSINRLLMPLAGRETLVRSAAGEPRPPSEVARSLNADFSDRAEDGQFYTLTYGVIDTTTGRTTYVRAGQTPLLLKEAAGPLRVLHQGSMLIGMDPECDFEEFVLDLRPGDRLVLFSDGLTEAWRIPGKDIYGESRLCAMIDSTATLSIQDSVPAIIADLKTWLGGNKPHDDVSLLAIERSPNQARRPAEPRM
jgi:sigma-B regulation protein RsbU (phosphoserine phosphatase)